MYELNILSKRGVPWLCRNSSSWGEFNHEAARAHIGDEIYNAMLQRPIQYNKVFSFDWGICRVSNKD